MICFHKSDSLFIAILLEIYWINQLIKYHLIIQAHLDPFMFMSFCVTKPARSFVVTVPTGSAIELAQFEAE